MKKVTIILNTESDNERIKSSIIHWYRCNGEEHLIKKIEVEDENM